MSTTLTAAHNQWASRPADQTFDTIRALHEAVEQMKARSRGFTALVSNLRVQADKGNLLLTGKTGAVVELSNWSFSQLCQRAHAPASYISSLPATLAAQNLNHGLARIDETNTADEEREAKLLITGFGETAKFRAITSDRYERLWNADVTQRLVRLVEAQPQWKLPLAYDRHGGTRGTPDANGMVPRGAYASDRDCFVFLVDESRPVIVPGSNPVNRGFFLWNSEVGAKSFGICTFLYDYVCGNHYVWGASNVQTFRLRHVGELMGGKAQRELESQVRSYSLSSAATVEEQIKRAQRLLLGKDKDEAVENALNKRINGLTRGRLEKAFDIAESTPRYGDPRSLWGIVSGLTELSQASKNTDSRVDDDEAAGKLMKLVF